MHVFAWLPALLTLPLSLLHLRHRRLVSAEIEVSPDDTRYILDSSDGGIIVTNGSGKSARFNQMADITSQTHELIARRSDGTSFPLSLIIKPAHEHAKFVFLGVARDISARKQPRVAISQRAKQAL